MSKKAVPLVITIVIAISIIVSLTWLLMPTLAGPQINEEWVIAYNKEDTYDCKSAQWVADEYGASLQDLNNETYNWDAFDRNIFIIGGSKVLSIEADWIGLKPEYYGISRPHTYPDPVQWTHTDEGKSAVVTSEREYICDGSHDYGMIVKGYDYTRRRWVIVVIGYSGYATGYGAKLVITEYGTVIKENSYIIYECTAHSSSDVNAWDMDDFDGLIVEYGG